MRDVEAAGREPAGDFVDFLVAGARVKGEFHCSECGYGVTVFRALPVCPMCGGNRLGTERLEPADAGTHLAVTRSREICDFARGRPSGALRARDFCAIGRLEADLFVAFGAAKPRLRRAANQKMNLSPKAWLCHADTIIAGSNFSTTTSMDAPPKAARSGLLAESAKHFPRMGFSEAKAQKVAAPRPTR